MAPGDSKRVLALLSLAHAVIHMFMGIVSVTLPAIIKELGASYTQVGIMRTAQAAGAGASSVLGGVATDFIGRRREILLLSVLWPTFFVFLAGFSSSFFMFALILVMRELLGGFLWHPPAIATIAALFPERKAFGFSMHEAAGNAGNSIGPLVTGFMLAYVTWRIIYHGYLIPGLAAALMLWLWLPSLGGLEIKMSKGFGFKEALKKKIIRNPGYLAVTFASGMRGAGENVLLTFYPLFLAYNLDKPVSVIGLSIFLMTMTATFSAPVVGALSDRMDRRLVIMLFMVSGGVTIYLLPRAESNIPIFLLSAIIGICLFGIRSVIIAQAIDLTPRELGGTSVGFIYTFDRVFGGFLPMIAGYIADAYGLKLSIYFLSLCVASGGLVVRVICRPPAFAE